jgi:hypothetical protein
VLATWIGRGVLSADELRALGDQMVPRFGDPEIQAVRREAGLAARGGARRGPARDARAAQLSNPPAEGITPEVTNTIRTIRTLRVLYGLADQGLRVEDAKKLTPIPHREQVKTKLADVFRIVTPYYL